MYLSRLTLRCSPIVLAITAGVFAGTVRHDVPTADYVFRSENYPSVGLVDADAGTGSGTLIAPGWVLTAGHVAGGVYNPEFGDVIEPSEIYWIPGLNAIDTLFDGQQFWIADQWLAHPNWTGFLEDGYDVGLVHLTPYEPSEEEEEAGYTPLPSITPSKRYMGTSSLTGKIGTAVGYGLTGDGRDGFEQDLEHWDFYRRAGDNTLDAMGGSLPDILAEFGGDVDIANQFIVGDFDDPQTQSGWTHNATNRMGGDTALPFEYSVAPADSGGGLFIDDDNNPNTPPVVAAVNSWIDGPDGTDNGSYDDIFGFAVLTPEINDWISSVITVPGDADSDFDVDLSDLSVLASMYGTLNGGHWNWGDFDADGDVDLDDLSSLAANYGGGQAQAFADFQALASGVPEPASVAMFGLGFLGLMRRVRLN